MGNTYEVHAWRMIPGTGGDYQYEMVHGGEDFEEAMTVMRRLKAEGVGCVKLEWRGQVTV